MKIRQTVFIPGDHTKRIFAPAYYAYEDEAGNVTYCKMGIHPPIYEPAEPGTTLGDAALHAIATNHPITLRRPIP